MSNTSYLAESRVGTRSGVAPGSVRLCVTLKVATFESLRRRAAESSHAVAGEAADIITAALTSSEAQS